MLSIAEMCLAYGDTLTYEGVTAVLGAADFERACALVGAILRSEMPAALAAAEGLLAEGKAVGVLLRDILSLLNEVAVAKTCANAEKLLSLPKRLFAAVKAVADGAEGSAILRATEIFMKTESELRFASSPRIALETAILRAAFPPLDADLDALRVRIADLERKVAALSAGAPVAAAAAPVVEAKPAPAPRLKAERPQPAAEELPPPPPFDDVPLWEMTPPPPEAEIAPFAEPPAPFAEPPAPFAEAAPSVPPAREAAQPAVQRAPQGGVQDAETAFGLFLRKLRKLPKSGVLYALCRDLVPAEEGGRLVLTTDIRTVADTLGGEKHRAAMAEVFAEIGVSDFEVRFASADRAEAKDGIEQLKRDFADYPVEIKG